MNHKIFEGLLFGDPVRDLQDIDPDNRGCTGRPSRIAISPDCVSRLFHKLLQYLKTDKSNHRGLILDRDLGENGILVYVKSTCKNGKKRGVNDIYSSII